MTIVTVDGNIGCGKTSILNYLHKYHKISIDLEPVDSWNTYLTKLYDEKNDVFKFQVRIWLDRCWIQEKTDKALILMERSPYFIRNTFIATAYDNAMITDSENIILNDLHAKTDSLWSCNTYIYFRSTPDNCLKRIKKRNRQSEKNITLEYLQQLHNYHEETYQKSLQNNMNVTIIEIDDKNVSDIANEILQYLQFTKYSA